MVKIFIANMVIALMLGAVVGLGAIRDCRANQAERQATEEVVDVPPAYTLTAGQLGSAFLDDEEGADVAYGGQVVQISGILNGVDDGANPPFVVFDGGVRCFMTEEEADKVKAVEGQRAKRVIMKGRVEKREFFLKVRGCIMQGTEAMTAPSVFGP